MRDQAAAALRISFKSEPESAWTPVVERITKGQSKTEIMELLQPFHVTSEGGGGSGQSYSESFRLDDQWVLNCHFYNQGDILISRSLSQSIRHAWVKPSDHHTGRWATYYVNGYMSHEIHLREGLYLGKFTTYFPNGQIA